MLFGVDGYPRYLIGGEWDTTSYVWGKPDGMSDRVPLPFNTFGNWLDSSLKREDYMIILNVDPSKGKWNDIAGDGEEQYRFICEKGKYYTVQQGKGRRAKFNVSKK